MFTKTIKYFWIGAILLLLSSCNCGVKQDEALVLQNTYNFNKKPKEEQNFYNSYYENSNQIKNIEKKIVYKAEPKPTPKPKPEIKKPEPVLVKPKDDPENQILHKTVTWVSGRGCRAGGLQRLRARGCRFGHHRSFH